MQLDEAKRILKNNGYEVDHGANFNKVLIELVDFLSSNFNTKGWTCEEQDEGVLIYNKRQTAAIEVKLSMVDEDRGIRTSIACYDSQDFHKMLALDYVWGTDKKTVFRKTVDKIKKFGMEY